jgi:hypothetical protein|tara:strand:- start:617 stop:1219 length:603 start_codon:yes stop_codon:yes gene_type:complete
MFHGCSINLNPVALGKIMRRTDVPIGHVFRYVDTANSQGYLYAHLDIHGGNGIYYALKFSNDAKSQQTASPMTFTATPSASNQMSRDVKIVGYYNFVVTLDKVPEVMPLSSITNASTAVSFKSDYDEKDYPHIYLVLGETIGETTTSNSNRPLAEDKLVLQLTKPFQVENIRMNALRGVPKDTIAAKRGTVSVNIYEGDT